MAQFHNQLNVALSWSLNMRGNYRNLVVGRTSNWGGVIKLGTNKI